MRLGVDGLVVPRGQYWRCSPLLFSCLRTLPGGYPRLARESNRRRCVLDVLRLLTEDNEGVLYSLGETLGRVGH